MGFRFVQIKGLAPFGPNKGQNKENLDKSSKIFFFFFKLSPWGHKWPSPKGLNFYIVIHVYREILKKTSSQELHHQIGQ